MLIGAFFRLIKTTPNNPISNHQADQQLLPFDLVTNTKKLSHKFTRP